MAKDNILGKIILAVVLGVVLQVAMVYADRADSPSRAVLEFTKAYYGLDPAMAERLCKELTSESEQDLVDAYLYRVAEEGRQRGFDIAMMKGRLLEADTFTLNRGEAEAEVRITAKRITNVNPVFTVVSQLFSLGEEHEIDATLKVVKEADGWKVCGTPFELAGI